MTDLGQNIRNIVLKGVEVIGSTASSIASTTKQKVDEYNLQGEKNDLLNAIGARIVELWKQGEKLPEELTAEVEKVILIEEQLKVMQQETSIQEEKTEEPEQEQHDGGTPEEEQPQMDFPQTAEYAAQDDHDIPVIEVRGEKKEEQEEPSSPLSSAINDLFEQVPPVDKMAERVNSSLDELGESLRRFSGEFGKELDRFTDQMMGQNEKKEDK